MSATFSLDIQAVLALPETGALLLLAIGNTLRGDDSAGPYIAQNLAGQLKHIQLIDCGEKPENYLDEITALKPGKVIILDAADFGGIPGELRAIPKEAIPQNTISTHLFPLSTLAALIEEDTKAKVYFFGLQVQNVSLGSVMSQEVLSTADSLISYLKEQDSHA
ncbi:MAG: hydrogenase 3 maturation endopeptidase HyCI [Candidatus Margulisiibacteriota bacterium]|jgi:hydrogenase 3 maturation protease